MGCLCSKDAHAAAQPLVEINPIDRAPAAARPPPAAPAASLKAKRRGEFAAITAGPPPVGHRSAQHQALTRC